MTKRRITLADLAREAGVSKATASMAVRDLAVVAPATRSKIQALAIRMGYEPNEIASLLARQRKGGFAKNSANLVPVAWADTTANSQKPDRTTWRRRIIEKMQFKFGLKVSPINLYEFTDPLVASRVLWTQGYRGILLDGPVLSHWTEKQQRAFSWDRFCVVKTSRDYSFLAFHHVGHSAFEYMAMVMKKLANTPHRRVAVLLHHSSCPDDDLSRLGAVYSYRELLAEKGFEIECQYASTDQNVPMTESLACWLRKFRPDVIVADAWVFYLKIRKLLKALGYPGFIAAMSEMKQIRGMPRITGGKRNFPARMELAFTLMHESLARGEHGFPKTPIVYALDPIWTNGQTILNTRIEQTYSTANTS